MTDPLAYDETQLDALFEEDAAPVEAHVVQDEPADGDAHPLPRQPTGFEEEVAGDEDDLVTPVGSEAESGAPSPATVDFMGRTLDRDYAERVVGFMDWAAGNPHELQLLNQILNGELVGVPPSQLKAPQLAAAGGDDDELDIDEPIRRRLAALQAQVTESQEQARVAVESTRAANLAQANAAVDTAKKTFQARYQLNDDEMRSVEQTLFATQALPGYVRQSGNVITGTERALEATYLGMPGSVEKIVAQRMTQQREDGKRSRKQAAIGGSSGSVSRAKPEPRTREEHLAAAISEIANSRLGVTEPGA